MVITCPRCGLENSPDTSFCAACDHFLGWGDSESSEFSDGAPRRLSPEPPPPSAAGSVSRPQLGPSTRPSAVGDAVSAVNAVNAVPEETPTDIASVIRVGRQIAVSRGRPDLEQHLIKTTEQLAVTQIPVVVMGEFKQGKSTLVNALLQMAICPVDADVVTAVPTSVRYAEEPTVTRYVISEDGRRLDEEQMPVESLEDLVTEEAEIGQPERGRLVEVGVPHRMLKSGLSLVDTPGVGGLESAHGHLTLGALRYAEGVLFLTDAAQELTAPELEFLRTAAERCSRIALVVTKIDLYSHWRRVVEIDRNHLSRAGLNMPILAVSSFLRLRAATRPDLNAESGFAELVTFLARDVVAATRMATERRAAAEIDFVTTQLEQQLQAERAVIEAPERGQTIAARLDVARREAKELTSPTATWQLTLGDGLAQLEADVDFDLKRRVKVVLQEGEAAVDNGDPKDTWTDLEVWLRRQLAMATVANRDLMVERAEALAFDVAERFELPTGLGLRYSMESTTDVLEAAKLAPVSSLSAPGGKLTPLMLSARMGYLPIMLGGALVGAMGIGLIGAFAIVGISAVVGGGVGAKIFTGERHRQLAARRQAAKAAVRKFVDDVYLEITKQTLDGLRSTRQQLRDDFYGRAALLERSAREAAEGARTVSELTPEQRRVRARELAVVEARLKQVRSAAHLGRAEGAGR